MSTVDGVRYEADGAVATCTFDRPASSNAMDVPMQARYGALLRQADADPAIRAVVVTGAGRAFCPGADLGLLDKIATRPPLEDNFRDVLVAAAVGVPVVAAINGGCAGLGFVIACSADVRFAAAGAKFTTAFARRGLIAEYGIAKLLPELVGQGRARDLLLSGRTFTAEDALGYGLVQEVVPPGELQLRAHAYATELATYSAPRSMAVMKRQFAHEASLPLPEAARSATELMLESFGRPELAEGLASWNERRPPRFPPAPADR
ncbi:MULTISPECIES: enoyl-CoA hydratase-related protein [unclassified Amycolatopsis]|uniref:enoyl-CoA hydratase-related protein n=1 Tax=unclassified Amycolatopsis TaxID=2618356 RepID=UPI0028743EB5|nr:MULTISPECIES: enoyl-CoA hydratase-related protein [unclassified Amycolatopsis]MDS0140317.1 enoyl-CoA hydratase/isomerase family protein [Amycolatopsis sp. 505]MDS0149079.1 enoyl-CoA hydratase/isomerase family protein [Amycolatopsis sp. CM201R]